MIALDPASSGFFEDGRYHLRTESRHASSQEMVAMHSDWARRYPVAVLEDGLAEDDWEGWTVLNRDLGRQIELVGDDLFVTNVERIARGIRDDVANAVLIKLNPRASRPAEARRRLDLPGETLVLVSFGGFGVELDRAAFDGGGQLRRRLLGRHRAAP